MFTNENSKWKQLHLSLLLFSLCTHSLGELSNSQGLSYPTCMLIPSRTNSPVQLSLGRFRVCLYAGYCHLSVKTCLILHLPQLCLSWDNHQIAHNLNLLVPPFSQFLVPETRALSLRTYYLSFPVFSSFVVSFLMTSQFCPHTPSPVGAHLCLCFTMFCLDSIF